MTDRPVDEGHERHGESVAAYLLAALPELEAQAFERHLMGCSQCRDELELLRPAVGALPQSVPPVRPPTSLKVSLMQTVRAEAKAASPSKPRRRWVPQLRVSVRPALAWTTAAVIACAGIAGGFGVATLGEGARAYSASVGEATPGASASLEVEPDNDPGAVVSVSGMPTLPSERDTSVYQLWLVRGNQSPAPSAIFTVNDAGTGQGAIVESMEGVESVLVTREPPGGSRVPSEEPIISFDLS